MYTTFRNRSVVVWTTCIPVSRYIFGLAVLPTPKKGKNAFMNPNQFQSRGISQGTQRWHMGFGKGNFAFFLVKVMRCDIRKIVFLGAPVLYIHGQIIYILYSSIYIVF